MEVIKNAWLLICSVQQPVIVATDTPLTCGVGRHRNICHYHQSRSQPSEHCYGRCC